MDMDRERVSLSLKSTQEDPWQQFARTLQIGQVVPGRVTKLVPFGAFVRVEEGIRGPGAHLPSFADRHVEIHRAGRAGRRGDLRQDHRHRPGLSAGSRCCLRLKQANEGAASESAGDEFDPTLYGMPATYDEAGNYQYPDGFDPESGDWLPGFESQREEWERQYAEARARFEAHRQQIEASRAKAEEEGEEDGEAAAAASSSSSTTTTSSSSTSSRPRAGGRPGAPDSNAPSGTLASDEALAALRDKLLSGQKLGAFSIRSG